MKHYIVYNQDGEEIDTIKAVNHIAAEKKARKMYKSDKVSVSYTEI